MTRQVPRVNDNSISPDNMTFQYTFKFKVGRNVING